MLILNVIYVIIAIAMVVLILMQRGAGATAGSGFGGGASGTVFGARGSSNFLSKSTKYLAIAFMSISLFMAWHVKRGTTQPSAAPASDLGVMGSVPTAPSTTPSTAPTAPATTPAAPANQSVPATNANPQPEQPVKN